VHQWVTPAAHREGKATTVSTYCVGTHHQRLLLQASVGNTCGIQGGQKQYSEHVLCRHAPPQAAARRISEEHLRHTEMAETIQLARTVLARTTRGGCSAHQWQTPAAYRDGRTSAMGTQVRCCSTLTQAAAQRISGEHLRHTGTAETIQCAQSVLARTTKGCCSANQRGTPAAFRDGKINSVSTYCVGTLTQTAAQRIGGEHLRHTGMAQSTEWARSVLACTTRDCCSAHPWGTPAAYRDGRNNTVGTQCAGKHQQRLLLSASVGNTCDMQRWQKPYSGHVL
jgi:hypothetical protein